MKKTLMTCLAIVALFAVAGSANAITCTVDQRPAATLLVPYFEAAFNPDGTITTGAGARDTLVTIGNASSAPMVVHVNVYNERSVLVLDFNICLTGYDIQAMSMAQVLSGNLPGTPISMAHVAPVAGSTPDRDPCQRNPLRRVYPDPAGFIRVHPIVPANGDDNSLATCVYPLPAWPPGSDFAFQTLDSLDDTPDSLGCAAGTNRIISGPIRGYIAIDHANYCNLSNPADGAPYYRNDAIGMENNLFGEVIFLSGTGLPTMGGSTVNIEADPSFGAQTDTTRARTFYARYWRPSQDNVVPPPPAPIGCANCTGTLASGNNLFLNAPWNIGIGDQREPLGLKYAARWFDTPIVTSNFNVWRGSSPAALGTFGPLWDLTGSPGGRCTDVEPLVTLVFFDEDENTVTAGVCPSPCTTPTFNFPFETQRSPITRFSHPAWPAGWVNMTFFNPGAPLSGRFDQAWVEYDFQGPTAFLSISAPATQLDPSACNPLGVGAAVNVITPAIPAVRGAGHPPGS